MRRMKAALLAALCLFWTLPAAASAWDSEPRLVLQEEGDRVYLTVEGLEDQVYGLQLELTLEGSCPDAAFTAEELDAYVPDCRAEAEGGETAVTIYMSALTGEDPINRGRRLYLGYLEPKSSCTLPDWARLTLLDRDLRSYTETVSIGSDFRDDYDGDGYRIYTNDPSHGTLRVRPSFAEEGETVTVTVTPDSGYELEELTASFGRRDLRLTDRGGGSYTFTMPDGEVDVEASFRLREGGALPFTDIPEGFWCYDEVGYVYERGLMNGTGPNSFSPNGSTTRSMIVAILYRMEGSPAVGSADFTDVSSGMYYAPAVAWASANGIVNGYSDGTFRPNAAITREQMAAFLYRYARYKGSGVSQRADLSAYTDAAGIAGYAVEAMAWANAAGLVNGTSQTTLSPRGTATRAQAAVILTRFARNL